MARIRTIKPEFFKHEDLAELQPITRLMFIGLWCQCDSAGRLEDRPKRLKADIFPYDEVDVDEMLDELHDYGFIVRYEAEGKKCIAVPKFLSHQRITGTEAKYPSKIPPPIETSRQQHGNTLETTRQQLGNNSDDRNKERRIRNKERNTPYPQGVSSEPETAEAPLPPKQPPEFDDRLEPVWKHFVEVQIEADPKRKPMKLDQKRRYALAAALDEHQAPELISAWRWCMLSPSEKAQCIRLKWSGIETFLNSPLKYVEQSQEATGPPVRRSAAFEAVLDQTLGKGKVT